MAEIAPRMRYVRPDVHKETITIAVAEEAGRPETWGSIANDPQAVRRLSTISAEGRVRRTVSPHQPAAIP